MDKVKDDIKEKRLSADDVYDSATWRRMSSYKSTPHKSGNKMKESDDLHLLMEINSIDFQSSD